MRGGIDFESKIYGGREIEPKVVRSGKFKRKY